MSGTYSYEVLEPGGHARLVGNVLDRISRPSANPASAAGSSRAILGDPETASWMERTTAADGAALIESVKGNTLRWNQLYNALTFTYNATSGAYGIVADGTGKWTVTVNESSTSGDGGNISAASIAARTMTAGHKYLITTKNANIAFFLKAYGTQANTIFTASTAQFSNVALIFSNLAAGTYVLYPQLFDLTAMFGAGNEPATVAEFEALFPEPYYPYDAGSLLPVRMEGVETVGFNQWDGLWESGTFDTTTGAKASSATGSNRNVNPISVMPSTAYYFSMGGYNIGSSSINVFWYDASMNLVLHENRWSANLTSPTGAHYMNFSCGSSWTAEHRGKTCINISDPSRNGTYEPYWRSERTIPASTYFPNGMRSAGSVRDELTETERITRIGVVDMGTLTWTASTITVSGVYRMYTTGLASLAAHPSSNDVTGNIVCGKYDTLPFEGSTSLYGGATGIAITSNGNVSVYDPAYNGADSAAAFKTAMNGVMLHYELATPTTTPVTQPMAYRTGKGGTERVMVASGTTSAPPIFATRYPLDPADLAASIAPVDGPTAKTNHQVGDLLMLGFTLCKATQVIVTGETIEIGTNVTKTTVAAELAALSE